MRFFLIPLTVAASLVSAPAVSLEYYLDPETCRPAAEREAAKRGIAKSDIRNIHIDKVFSGSAGEAKPPPDFVAWMTVRQCPSGSFIVNMTSRCQVQDVYTRGGCTIEGVPRY